jgi:hypothetical protein
MASATASAMLGSIGLQRLVDAFRQAILHHRIAEDVGPENLARGRLAEIPGVAVRLVVVDGGNSAGTGGSHGKVLLFRAQSGRRMGVIKHNVRRSQKEDFMRRTSTHESLLAA